MTISDKSHSIPNFGVMLQAASHWENTSSTLNIANDGDKNLVGFLQTILDPNNDFIGSQNGMLTPEQEETLDASIADYDLQNSLSSTATPHHTDIITNDLLHSADDRPDNADLNFRIDPTQTQTEFLPDDPNTNYTQEYFNADGINIGSLTSLSDGTYITKSGVPEANPDPDENLDVTRHHADGTIISQTHYSNPVTGNDGNTTYDAASKDANGNVISTATTAFRPDGQQSSTLTAEGYHIEYTYDGNGQYTGAVSTAPTELINEEIGDDIRALGYDNTIQSVSFTENSLGQRTAIEAMYEDGAVIKRNLDPNDGSFVSQTHSQPNAYGIQTELYTVNSDGDVAYTTAGREKFPNGLKAVSITETVGEDGTITTTVGDILSDNVTKSSIPPTNAQDLIQNIFQNLLGPLLSSNGAANGESASQNPLQQIIPFFILLLFQNVLGGQQGGSFFGNQTSYT